MLLEMGGWTGRLATQSSKIIERVTGSVLALEKLKIKIKNK